MQTSSKAGCVLVLCLLCAAVPGSSGAPDRVLFDFESGTYDGWTVEGDAFGRAPFPAAEALAWRPDRRPHGMQGRYFVKSGGERHQANPDGRLVSDAFTIDRPYLTFLLGGELHPRVRVSLEVEGRAVRVAYGNNSYDLRLRGWDVREWRGRQGRVVIEDRSDFQSLIRVDDFLLSDTPAPPVWDFDTERPQESDLVRPGEFRPIYIPDVDGVIQHTSITRGHDGRWHLYGSVAADAWARPSHMLHATADAPDGVFRTVRAASLTAEAAHGEAFIRDPHVVFHDGTYYAFYVGSGTWWTGWDPDNRWQEGYYGWSLQGPFGIHLATSRDGDTWQRQAKAPLFTDQPFAFSPFVTRVGDAWVMYYAGTDPADLKRGVHGIIARTSRDLVRWSDRRVVFLRADPIPWPEHSFVKDPVVWRRGDEWFLLAGPIGNTNQSRFHYRQLYRSCDPFRWETPAGEHSPLKGFFLEGGATIVRGADGTEFITHSGPWAGGVWIARLHWR
jgi:hypothetical protein